MTAQHAAHEPGTACSRIAGGGVIPVVNVAPLFDGDSPARIEADRALSAAARKIGFVLVGELPEDEALRTLRSRLLSIFTLSDAEKRRLYRRKFAPENRNVYRGWFPLQPGNLTAKEGIDIGADIAHGTDLEVAGDPLRERSPMPDDQRLPGWRAAVATYHLAMERIAEALMRSLARSLGLQQHYFDAAFRQGLSTLRIIRYPRRDATELATVPDPAVWVDAQPGGRYLAGAPHTDSGFITLLSQGGVGGLQVRARDGTWLDVAPLERTLVVNFGEVLEQWSAGRVRATEHRVIGAGLERYSIPFFYEARAEATIAPLPIDPPDSFAPFSYGDFLWKRITSFVEFRGMEAERRLATNL